MAVKTNSGDLRHSVVFKQPTSSLNDQRETEITYASAFTTLAKVDRFNQFRTAEANATTLIGALDFTIRWTTSRDAITKDWLINYNSVDYIIHEIEKVDQKQMFIRFTAKAKNG